MATSLADVNGVCTVHRSQSPHDEPLQMSFLALVYVADFVISVGPVYAVGFVISYHVTS